MEFNELIQSVHAAQFWRNVCLCFAKSSTREFPYTFSRAYNNTTIEFLHSVIESIDLPHKAGNVQAAGYVLHTQLQSSRRIYGKPCVLQYVTSLYVDVKEMAWLRILTNESRPTKRVADIALAVQSIHSSTDGDNIRA